MWSAESRFTPSHCEQNKSVNQCERSNSEETRETHAGREEDLSSKAVRAVLLEESGGGLLPSRVSGVRVVVVEADEGNRLVRKERRVVGTTHGASSDHSKSRREGHDGFVLGSGSLEVIGVGVGGDSLKRALDRLVVVQLEKGTREGYEETRGR